MLKLKLPSSLFRLTSFEYCTGTTKIIFLPITCFPIVSTALRERASLTAQHTLASFIVYPRNMKLNIFDINTKRILMVADVVF